MRHPEHDALVDTVRGWYAQSYPDMGYHREERQFGFYSRNVRVGSARMNCVTLRPPSPFDPAAFISDLHQYYTGQRVQIWVDDPCEAERIGPLLEANGCSRGTTTVYLAHVGTPPRANAPPGVTVAPVREADVDEYARVKLMACSSDESQPSPEDITANAAILSAEMSGCGRFSLARQGAEAVTVVAWYEGPPDRFIFQLATRLPFRRRGIARYLICSAVLEASLRGHRSTIINADMSDTIVDFYRRLGFTDQVLCRQAYLFLGDEVQQEAGADGEAPR